MNILVTGGAGYIGTELVYKLASMSKVRKISVYDNLCKGNYNLFTGLRKIPHRDVNFIHADILDSRAFRKSLQGCDTLIHLAAIVETPFSEQSAHEFEQTNHWGSAEVAYAVEESNVERVIVLSSQAVYGAGIVESAENPLSPQNFYGISKKRGEEHFLRLMGKLDILLIRCATVFGYSKNQRFETVLNKLLFQAHFFNKVAIQGNPTSSLSYVSMTSLVDCLANVLEAGMLTGVQNLSQISLSLEQIESSLRGLYPTLETIFVDQHMSAPDLNMKCSPAILEYMQTSKGFTEDLLNFKAQFTF